MRRLEGATELLEAPGADPREVAAALDDLARVNRVLLGTRLTLAGVGALLDGAPAGSRVTLLDVGCGGGDMAAVLGRWARQRGFAPRVLGVDATDGIVEQARARVGGEVELLAGDVRELPLADDAADVAVCSLLLHHLEPDDAVQALGELGRVASRGVVVNDLVRTPLGLAGAHVVARLARSPITRHDAVVSVRRAYTRDELLALVGRAGLRPVRVLGALGYRVAIAAAPV
jgi:SAM-dependent methyltransferase